MYEDAGREEEGEGRIRGRMEGGWREDGRKKAEGGRRDILVLILLKRIQVIPHGTNEHDRLLGIMEIQEKVEEGGEERREDGGRMEGVCKEDGGRMEGGWREGWKGRMEGDILVLVLLKRIQVIPHGTNEHDRLLGDDGETASELGKPKGRGVHAVDEDGSFIRINHTIEDLHQRGLA
jgi:hypothetical protein